MGEHLQIPARMLSNRVMSKDPTYLTKCNPSQLEAIWSPDRNRRAPSIWGLTDNNDCVFYISFFI